MAGTKDSILKTALKLFNEVGTPNVSQRAITDLLKISPGNLTYHFKKKEDIETELYFRLVSKIDSQLKLSGHSVSTVRLLVNQLDGLMNAFFEYRFIFLDFVHIMRNNKTIAEFHLQLFKKRRDQFNGIITRYVEAGIFRKEELANEYQYLYERLAILSDFWILEAEITRNGVKKTHLKKYRNIILYSIYPYLTERGQNEFFALIQ